MRSACPAEKSEFTPASLPLRRTKPDGNGGRTRRRSPRRGKRFADFDAQAGDNTPVIFRTHPTDKKRIEQIEVWLPKARPQYRPQN